MTMSCSEADDEQAACICVVDDDASVRHALINLLEAGGYRCRAFDSGEALLASHVFSEIDVALFDVKLRGMSGFALHERFATLVPDVPVLFISGHSDRDMEKRAVQMGALALLRKPVDPDVLFDHIEHALDLRRGAA
jgi:FixJ family two-component response regulator